MVWSCRVEGERLYYNVWLESREKHLKKKIFSQQISFIASQSPVFHSANIYWYLPCAKYFAQIWKDTKMNIIESCPAGIYHLVMEITSAECDKLEHRWQSD